MDSDTAPYAPVHNVLTVIRRLRDRGLNSPLTLKEVERVGVPEGNAPRTLAALRFLGLITDDGYLTPEFERLGKASTIEYPEALAEIIRAAYAPVFTIADPSEDSETTIQDAFRHYRPPAQRPRMVTLFLGLCREAGIIAGGPPTRKAKMRGGSGQVKPSSQSASKVVRNSGDVRIEVPTARLTLTTEGERDYRLISALMQQLPSNGKWSRLKRDQWVQTVSSAVDLLTDITEEEASSG